MAVLSLSGRLTIVEAAKASHNGEMLKIAEILYKMKPAIMHTVWKEANDMMSNVEAQRYSLPQGTWRQFNAGVPSEIGRRKQIRDTIGMLQSYFNLDKDLVDIQPNPQQYLNDEVVGGIEGLSQTWASQYWYGNALVNPERWTGLAPRMSALNTTTIQGCGGTGASLTSMYITLMGPDTVYMVHPRGSQSWLQHKDLGEDTEQLSTGYKYQVYRQHFSWFGGLVVKDPLAIGRVANIIPTGNASQWDDNVFIRVTSQLRNRGQGAVSYVTRNVYAQILIAAKDKGNVWYMESSPWGDGEVPTIAGIPVYIDEMISEAETVIS